jgi:hypothetical protein
MSEERILFQVPVLICHSIRCRPFPTGLHIRCHLKTGT